MAHIRGETERLITNVRRKLGERTPGQWLDTDIVDAANEVQDHIFMEILHPANAGYGVYTFNVSFVAAQEMYDLPYGFISMCEFSQRDDSGDHIGNDDVIDRRLRSWQEGVWIEDHKLGVSPIPDAADSNCRKLYFVRKPVPIHVAEAKAAAATSLTLGVTASLGEILTQSNAYLGARIQILDGTTGEGEISTVSAHVGSTGVATVDTWGTTPTGTITYEIMPDLPPEAYNLWWTSTALELLDDEDAGSAGRLARLMKQEKEYRSALRWVAHSRSRRQTQPIYYDPPIVHC